MIQQDLCGQPVVAFKAALVGLDQSHLAHRGGGLEIVDTLWTGIPPQADNTLGDRAGGDQHDLTALIEQLNYLLDPAVDSSAVQTLAVIGQQ